MNVPLVEVPDAGRSLVGVARENWDACRGGRVRVHVLVSVGHGAGPEACGVLARVVVDAASATLGVCEQFPSLLKRA